jgi:hypothetical protein
METQDWVMLVFGLVCAGLGALAAVAFRRDAEAQAEVDGTLAGLRWAEGMVRHYWAREPEAEVQKRLLSLAADLRVTAEDFAAEHSEPERGPL